MIKLKIGQILESFGTYNAGQGALRRLSDDDGLPVKTLFAVRKIIQSCAKEIDAYEETRVALLDQFAKKGDDGKRMLNPDNSVIFQDDDAAAEFAKAHMELVNTEVELNITPLTPDAFEPRKITAKPFLSAHDLLMLDWLIVDEIPSPKL